MACSNFFQELKTEFLKDFSRSFLRNNENNYFLAIGRPLPWSRDEFSETLNFDDYFYAQFDEGNSGGLTGDDINIPEISNVQKNKSINRMGNILLKRVNEDNFSFLVPNYTWTKGATYDAYDDTENLFNPNKKFFVFNKYDNSIYKCLENAGGASSTVDPEESYTEGSFLLDDGYRWKLIYKISNTDQVRFSINSGDDLVESYVPVKMVDFNYNLNDTEQVQYDLQTSAIRGSIESLSINPEFKNHITFDNKKCVVEQDNACAVYSNGNSGATEVSIIACGGLTDHPVAGNGIWTDYLSGLVFNVVSGIGVGQRRIIKRSQIINDPTVSYIRLELKDPLDHGVSGFSGSTPLSFFTIEPQVKVSGDGTSITNGNMFGNSHLTKAEVRPIFEPISGEQTKTLSNIDIINTGKNYTRAKAEFVTGITHHYPNDTGATLANKIASFNTNRKNFLRPILPPEGGHGSNPLVEMGCDKMLFRINLDSDEEGIVNAENDFRQVSLVKNPLFNDPITQLRFVENGTNQLVVGNMVEYGENKGTISRVFNFSEESGNEVLVKNTSGSFRGATFVYISDGEGGGDGITFNIDPFDGFREYRIVGSENRSNLILEVETTESNTYFPRDILIGLGSSENATYSSLASGMIREVKAIANKRIFVLEDVQGTFRIGEKIGVINKPKNEGISSLQILNNSKVLSYRHSRENRRDSYSFLTRVTLGGSLSTSFLNDMFYEDQPIYSFTTNALVNQRPIGEVFGSAHLFTWNITDSDEVVLDLVGAKKGMFRVGDYIPYFYSEEGGVIFGTISSVQDSDIEYDSGEILFVQNFEPIERSELSREEISLILGL